MVISRHRLPPTTRRLLAHHGRIHWHVHDEHQLIYLHRGVLTVSTDDGVVVVPAHRAVWLPTGHPHAHLAHGATEFRSVMYGPDVEPAGATGVRTVAASTLLRAAVLALTDPVATRGDAARARLREVVLDEFRVAETPTLRLPTPRDPRLAAVAELFARDPADARPLGELARAVGTSERTLSRLFRAELGTTFPRWRTQVRLFHAAISLGSDHTVAATAARLGFGSSSALISAFRETFGTTPGRAAAAIG